MPCFQTNTEVYLFRCFLGGSSDVTSESRTTVVFNSDLLLNRTSRIPPKTLRQLVVSHLRATFTTFNPAPLHWIEMLNVLLKFLPEEPHPPHSFPPPHSMPFSHHSRHHSFKSEGMTMKKTRKQKTDGVLILLRPSLLVLFPRSTRRYGKCTEKCLTCFLSVGCRTRARKLFLRFYSPSGKQEPR